MRRQTFVRILFLFSAYLFCLYLIYWLWVTFSSKLFRYYGYHEYIIGIILWSKKQIYITIYSFAVFLNEFPHIFILLHKDRIAITFRINLSLVWDLFMLYGGTLRIICIIKWLAIKYRVEDLIFYENFSWSIYYYVVCNFNLAFFFSSSCLFEY